MQPVAVIGGLSPAASERIVELWLRDRDGGRSDELDVTLDDRDFAVPIPEESAILTPSIGYAETGLVAKGSYKVDSMRVTGPPYHVRLIAKAVDVQSAFKEIDYHSYTNKTLREIVDDVAGRHSLSAMVSPALAGHVIDFEAQSEESALHFLTRLANRYDATFKVADGRVLFVEKGTLQSATGQQMGAIVVTFGNLIDYSCEVLGRPRHKQGRSRWWDRDHAREQRSDAQAGGRAGSSQTRYQSSTSREARRRAGARANSSRRSRAQMSVTIIGNPNITTEAPVVVMAVRSGLNGVWRAKRITHNLSGSNVFTTKIECEKPNSDRSAGSVGVAQKGPIAPGPGVTGGRPDAPAP
jgi:hypothetical protein